MNARPITPLPRGTSLASMLHAVFAFNLTFLINELGLVIPKALTPGLSPTLYHNDHAWRGHHPLAELFQGTGAVATLLVALACAFALSRRPVSPNRRLFLFWMAFCGVFMALPQFVMAALHHGTDVARALDYLALGAAGKTALALAALALVPVAALWLVRYLPRPTVWTVTVPGLLALPLIIAYRVPRELYEVVFLPVIAIVPAVLCMQAGAWRFGGRAAGNHERTPSIALPAIAAITLLVLFHAVLKPGVPFY